MHLLKPLAKTILIPLGLTAAVSAADAGVHLKNSLDWESSMQTEKGSTLKFSTKKVKIFSCAS